MGDEREMPLADELGHVLVAVEEKLAQVEKELRPLAAKKKALLRQKLARLNEILKERDALASQILALEQLCPDEDDGDKAATSIPATRSDSDYSGLTIWQASEDVLRRAQKPLQSAEIARLVIAGGRDIPAPPASKVSSVLSRKRDVFYAELLGARKKVWGLNEWRNASG